MDLVPRAGAAPPVRAGRCPCDCCGHWTLTAAPDGESLQLCAVCGWEDSEHWQRGEAALDLLVAQRAFVTDGVAVALLRDQVRPPTTDEQRDARWLPYDERARALLARVEATFADVRLGKGESPTEAIHQSQLTDNYGADYGPPPTPGRWHPVGAHGWPDVTRAGVLALFGGIGGLNFMSGPTFRFFLPAIARLYLQEQANATRYDGPWFPLFHFARVDERRLRDLAGFTDAQRQWLAEFFAFATRPGTFASRRTVRAGTERVAWRDYWRAQLPTDYVDVYGDALIGGPCDSPRMIDEGPEGPEGLEAAAATAPAEAAAAAPAPADALAPPDSWRPWVTIALIAINTVVFVITVALGANPLLPDPQKMIELGGNVAPLTLGSEPWRLVSAMFLHYGVIHLAMNMLGLWSGGLLAERMYGRAGYASLYLLAGLAGGLATVSHKADVVSAGASGAIFGVFGAIGAYLLAHRDRIDTQVLGRQTRGLLFFMGYNLLYGATQKSVDMSAHLGGLVGGFVVGLALTYGDHGRRAAARIAVVTVLGLGAVVAAVTTMPVPAASERQQAYAEFDRVQEQVTNAFNAMIAEAQAGTLTDEAFAERLERDILPPWQVIERRINQLPPPPEKVRPVHAAMVAFIAARREAWVAVDELLRGRTTDQEHVKALQRRAEDRLTALNEALAALN